MRENNLLLSLSIASLCLIICASFVSATETATETVPANNDKMLIFNLNEGYKFSGSLSISGGSGDDIDFYVTDPHGSRIVNLGRVSQGTSFEFTAQDSGGYTLHFDNTFSWVSSKVVTLSYDIQNPVLPNSDNFLLWIIAGAAVIAVVLIGIGVYALTKKK